MTPEEWKEKWPNHCTSCGGWGAYYTTQHDSCEAIDDLRICHRCSAPGLTEDGEGPCTECGWNYDDGVTEYYSDCGPDYSWEKEE